MTIIQTTVVIRIIHLVQSTSPAGEAQVRLGVEVAGKGSRAELKFGRSKRFKLKCRRKLDSLKVQPEVRLSTLRVQVGQELRVDRPEVSLKVGHLENSLGAREVRRIPRLGKLRLLRPNRLRLDPQADLPPKLPRVDRILSPKFPGPKPVTMRLPHSIADGGSLHSHPTSASGNLAISKSRT
jgi:hypothetical protein